MCASDRLEDWAQHIIACDLQETLKAIQGVHDNFTGKEMAKTQRRCSKYWPFVG